MLPVILPGCATILFAEAARHNACASHYTSIWCQEVTMSNYSSITAVSLAAAYQGNGHQLRSLALQFAA